MEKIAVGPNIGPGVVDIRRTPTENLRAIAKKKGVGVEDLTAVILDRPRHEALIAEVREAGARIRLITDGDVGGAIATSDPDAGIDVLLGTGGAPEGVLAAAALRCMNGYMQGILRPRNDAEIARAARMGIPDINHVFEIDELASGDVMFAATGITGGFLLRGVRFLADGAQSASLVMRSRTGTVRHILTQHRFEGRPSLPRGPRGAHLNRALVRRRCAPGRVLGRVLWRRESGRGSRSTAPCRRARSWRRAAAPHGDPVDREQQRQQLERQAHGVEDEGERDEAGLGDAGDAHGGDQARAGGEQLLPERQVDAVRLRDEEHGHAFVQDDAVVVEVGAHAGAERRRRARDADAIEGVQRDGQRREAAARAQGVGDRLARAARPRGAPQRQGRATTRTKSR